MVNLIDCGKREFTEAVKNKKLYCFGAGKYFQNFVDEGYPVKVEAIIDNYRYGDEMHRMIGKESVRVISMDSFLDEYDTDCAVLITCATIEEVLAQLDSIEKLDGLPCYVEYFVRELIEESEIDRTYIPTQPRIPKKIHYCWFGGNSMPEEYVKYIESWRKYCPDYEIIRWDETNYDVHKNRYMSQAYEQKKWAFVTDYARADILYQEGGIYLDTDVEMVASFDEFLVWDLFCGFEQEKYVAWGLGIGAIKGHPILKEVMDVYDKLSFVYEDSTLNLTPCPVIQSEVLQRHGFEMNGFFQVKDRMAVYPSDFFSPYECFKCFGRLTKNTHSIHHFAASWCDETQKNDKREYENRVLRIKAHNFMKSDDENYAESNKSSVVKRYQLGVYTAETKIAGSKAPMDVKTIAGKCGYQVIAIHNYDDLQGDITSNWQHRRVVDEWKRCYDTISDNSILLLQHPFWQEQSERNETLRRLKAEKRVKIISLVHDVESLRGVFVSEYMKAEFAFMLEIADVIVVHNSRMRDYFLDIGVEPERLVCLNVFDYLYKNEMDADKIFERAISIAGNLDAAKSPYIGKLGKLNGVKIHLYGPNYTQGMEAEGAACNIVYHGAFSPDEIPKRLNRGFGVIWDGESLDTCTGNTGTYLRYNNPHKLSLYLAAGLPVFIWKEAATAEYVVKNGLGIAIDSLQEMSEKLQDMDETTYRSYVENVKRISNEMREGVHTKSAIEKAEEIVLRSAEN